MMNYTSKVTEISVTFRGNEGEKFEKFGGGSGSTDDN